MKTKSQSSRSTRGFTLVELLVVIAIIVVLAGLGLAGAQLATRQARVAAARSDMGAIRAAIDGYYSEYSRLPTTSGDQVDTVSLEGREFVTVLLGMEDPSGPMQNPRKIAFLNIREGRNHSNGIVHQGAGSGLDSIVGIFDPWGHPYHIVLDVASNGSMPDPFKSGVAIRQQPGAVYSAGPDGKSGTADDVKTW